MKSGKYLVKSLLLVFAISFFSSSVFADCPEQNKSAYKKILKRAIKSGLPGALFFYQKDTCTVHLSKGNSNLLAKTELQKQDRFVVGSISKIFIGVVSVKLAESGVFNLDDSIKQWLPNIITEHIPNSDKITLRHLLSHSSGIINYIESPVLFRDFITDPYSKRSELDIFSKYIANKPLLFEPGTKYSYSNSNYLLMGLIIGSASNKHYTSVIRELIIEPLALRNTFHLAEAKQTYQNYSHGYMELFGKLLDTHDILPNFAFADGSIVSNAQDLSSFIQAVFTDKNFMNEKLLAILLSSPVKNSKYGLGINIYDKYYDIGYGHRGGEPGYKSFLSYIPASSETIISFVNGSDSALNLFSETFSNELKRERIQHQRNVSLAP